MDRQVINLGFDGGSVVPSELAYITKKLPWDTRSARDADDRRVDRNKNSGHPERATAFWHDAQSTAAFGCSTALALGKNRRILFAVMNALPVSTISNAAIGGSSLRVEISSGTNRTIAVRV